jgi:predicted dehydrogenase
MKENIYTVAIIGTGRIGFSLGFDKKREQPASHTMALLNNKRIKLIAGVDTDKENLLFWKKFVKEGEIFSDTKSFFASYKNKMCDIVTVAVNEKSHQDVALETIRNKPRLVILEKPVALNVEEALNIKTEAEKKQVPVLINHERRFALDYRLAKQLIPTIGELQNVNAVLSSGLRVYAKSEEKTGLYSLLHDGTHLVDIVRFLLSQQNENTELIIENIDGIYRDEKDMVRNCSVHFKSKNCPSVNFVFSGRSKYFGFEIDIRGTEGRIEIGNGFLRYWKSVPSKFYSGFKSLELIPDSRIKKGQYKGKTHYFSNMIKNAVDFLDGKEKLFSTIDDGIETLKILEIIKEKLF